MSYDFDCQTKKVVSHVVTFLSQFSLLISLVTHDSYKALEVCNQNNFHLSLVFDFPWISPFNGWFHLWHTQESDHVHDGIQKPHNLSWQQNQLSYISLNSPSTCLSVTWSSWWCKDLLLCCCRIPFVRLAVLMELSDCLILNLGDASGNNTIHSMNLFCLHCWVIPD